QGSTTTATVNGVHFLGQAIWRYHPEAKTFEVFAEGGGNTFSMEFDREGRAFSGSNYGDTRGLHYEQGGAYIKNWAKHGPLVNPYSFGWFEHMANKGFKPRFPQSMIVYEGGAMPGLEGQIIASMSLVNRVQASKLVDDTSTYRTEDTVTLVETDDRWFRPVDTKTGPDGAIYLADWYDSRLTHVDPRDTWDREHGRIYRLQAKGAKPVAPFDLGRSTDDVLIKTLSHPNKWYRQTAVRILGERKNRDLLPRLAGIVEKDSDHAGLEAFWVINQIGGFDTAFAAKNLKHANPSIRSWTIRLLADNFVLPPTLQKTMVDLARTESVSQVRAQLAASAKRWLAEASIPVIRELALRNEDANDKHIPLLIWWAIENKAVTERARVMGFLKESPLWQTPIFQKHLISRFGQRYTADRTLDNLNTAAELLALAPSAADVDLLVKGMEAGLQGDVVKEVPAALQKKLKEIWDQRPHTPTLVSFALRLNLPAATDAAIGQMADPKIPEADRKRTLALLAERRVEASVPALLTMLKQEKSESLRMESLNTLQRFGDPRVATASLEAYPTMTAKLRSAVLTMLSSRADWAKALMQAVDTGKIKKEQVSIGSLLTIQGFKDDGMDTLILKHWGQLRKSNEEKEQRIAAVRKLVTSGKGDLAAGRELFKIACSACHTLNGEGAKIGPELTGYERDNLDFMIPAIVDPSLGIREEFIGYNVTTKDDQSLTGLIIENNPLAIVLMDLSQNKAVIPREQIKLLKASQISLMPEGLLDAMTEQQIRDLFSYITKR
ncbi:MAG TPA: c-type cytochrome, partial [Roseimicrobium sp.]|nr:c-type cytochrome [Roseimicrobium sp.]